MHTARDGAQQAVHHAEQHAASVVHASVIVLISALQLVLLQSSAYWLTVATSMVLSCLMPEQLTHSLIWSVWDTGVCCFSKPKQ